jgi:hypothetical protein
MYNLYARDQDGTMLLAASNLTLDEALFRADQLLSEDAFSEVSIAKAGSESA